MSIDSSFPSVIDSLIFYQDLNLEYTDIFYRYQRFLRESNVSEAAQDLRQSGIPYYGAGLFNLIENRINSLQTYLKANPKHNPHCFSSGQPSGAANGIMWIG